MFPPIPFSFALNPIMTLLRSAQFYAPRTSSITQSRGSGTPTETRATTATVMGYAADAVLADGQTLLTVASGELRFKGARRVSEGVWSTVDADGVPIPDATLDGALIEAAATTITLKSRTFTDAVWSVATAGAVQDALGADGEANTGWTLTDNSAVAFQERLQSSTVSAANWTDSYLVKKTTGAQSSYPCVYAANGTNCAIATIDTTNGVATVWTAYTGLTPVTSSATCEEFNAAYWLVDLTFLATAAAWTQSMVPAATTNPTQSTGTFDVTAQGTAVFFDAQRELGTKSTSRINNTSAVASATRNKDVQDDQVSGNLTAAAGTVAFSWTPQHDPSGTVALGGSYVDASNYTVILHDATKYIFRKRIAGTNYDAELTASFVSGTTYDIALKWGADGSQIAVDGVLGTAHANTDPAQLGTRWQWGADGNSGQQAGAAFKDKYLFTKALSDSQLAAIT